MREQQHQPCDARPAVTMAGPSSCCDQQLHVTETEAIAASRHSYAFTLVFPGGATAVLQVHGETNQEEARAFACDVLPGYCYEVKDGDQSQGRAAFFSGWTCTQEQGCDGWSGVTAAAPGSRCDQQFHITETRVITASRHTSTCVFPGGEIAVVHVSGATSADHARAAVRSAWHLCRYEVQDEDPTNGYAAPFSLRLNGQLPGPKRNASLLQNAEEARQ